VARGTFWGVRLDRPDRRNALDLGMVRALHEAFAGSPAAPIVLDSTDPGVFCAGADLTVSDAERADISDLLYQCYEVMITRPGPVIAVISGPAVGGGAQLAGAADLRVAGPDGSFRWTGPPGRDLAVGAWLLPSLVGRGLALELTMTGRWVDAAEAERIGLVNRVYAEPGQAATVLAKQLADQGAGVPGAVKRVAAAGDLLGQLRAERVANRAALAALSRPAAP
jgi:enoyl-CoA hydratase/carnithine racemase